ncbi:hypothetical protein [Streptomyces acidiscabies]|uniref:hypothetical protein n=1 Tax=Streptomyces acidiscabies TaxID=42234 RepID=UPI0038F6D95D
MSELVDGVPTLSHEIQTDPVTVGPRPVATVDPASQLSHIGGQIALDVADMAGTACSTPSDGKDAIAIDHDENDD